MRCPRCLGFMVIDTCLNVEGDRNKTWIGEWRCLNCGEIFDPRTLENRASQRQVRQCMANMGAGSCLFS